MEDLFGFDITTREMEVNHILTPNSIKHIYLPVLFNLYWGPSSKYKEIPFSQLFPYVYCVFMTGDLTCIESNDKKFP